ncbi:MULTISPECIES: hypothetical protein [unclassified Parabacteroides]|uniref:hypothetical protein n=1 Tax=unclassified Parabacteroides TaxID=2649774 RepID=UPI002477014F|nr:MULTISPECIES: hypothetical protein [unclassified Parabacteroides]
MLILIGVGIISCNNPDRAKTDRGSDLLYHPSKETVDEFKERLGIDKVEPIFERYENDETYLSFCLELDSLFKSNVDSCFMADVDIDYLIQDLSPNEDTALSVEFTKEKFRIETVYEYCVALFFDKNYRIEQCNAYRYMAEELLMSKYYNLTLSLLESEDKKLLEQDQLFWLQSFNSSRDISLLITEPKYGNTGGREMSLFHLYYLRPNMLERAEYLFIWYKHLKEGRDYLLQNE